jgi:hypothetical protein
MRLTASEWRAYMVPPPESVAMLPLTVPLVTASVPPLSHVNSDLMHGICAVCMAMQADRAACVYVLAAPHVSMSLTASMGVPGAFCTVFSLPPPRFSPRLHRPYGKLGQGSCDTTVPKGRSAATTAMERLSFPPRLLLSGTATEDRR